MSDLTDNEIINLHFQPLPRGDPFFLLSSKPPEGYTFRPCDNCDCPYLYDRKSMMCLRCEIHKDEPLEDHKNDN